MSRWRLDRHLRLRDIILRVCGVELLAGDSAVVEKEFVALQFCLRIGECRLRLRQRRLLLGNFFGARPGAHQAQACLRLCVGCAQLTDGFQARAGDHQVA